MKNKFASKKILVGSIVAILTRNVDDFMYVNFRVFHDGFYVIVCHTVGIGSNYLIGGCDEYF